MGQSALILSVAATFTIVILLVVVGRNTKDSDDELAQYHFNVLTREVSTTGINMTVRRLVDEPYKWSDPTWPYTYTDQPYRGGTFSTTVTGVGIMVPNFYGIDQDTVDVVSIGRIGTLAGDSTHVIEARYVKGYIDLGLPPGLKKAVFADSILTLNGGVHILHSDPTQDAHIHGNDEISASGANNIVEGYGTVSDEPMGDMSHIKPSAEAIFAPAGEDYVEGDELVWADEPISLPEVDALAIYNAAVAAGEMPYAVPDSIMTPPSGSNPLPTYNLNGVTIRPGDFPCAPTCGTKDNPLVYYVPGNLDVNNIVIEGYVQFVVEGVLNFQGGSYGYVDANGDGVADPEPVIDTPEWHAWMDAQLEAGDLTKVGYYVEGVGEKLPSTPSVKVNGNFSLVGQIYSNGDIDLGGGGNNTVNIFGGVTSTGGSIDVNGGVTIRFAMLSDTVLIPGLDYVVPDGIILIAWAEW